jgi:hypothetical protein
MKVGDVVRHLQLIQEDGENQMGIVIAIRRPSILSSLGSPECDEKAEDGIEILNSDGTVTVTIQSLLEVVNERC